jgi:DNA polymerase
MKVHPIPTYAVDFETYYDKDISVTIQGAPNYAAIAHLYMVSIYGPGVEYSGPLETAPWESIRGLHWVSHNAGFDAAVFAAGVSKGQIDEGMDPSSWDCTADLARYFGLGGSLKDAVFTKYGIELPKTARDKAKGKKWPDDFSPEDQKEMLEYALSDAKHCWNLWNDLGKAWPEEEVRLSRITRKHCLEGVCVDIAELDVSLKRLSVVMDEARDKIPWASEGVISSLPRIKKYCEEKGIPSPSSTAKGSEECEKWLEQHDVEHPLVSSIRKYRKAERMHEVVRAMLNRVMPNGRMAFGLKYFGAHTGRWSGSDGLNMQNPNKEPVFGVDIRSCMVAAPGKKFIIWDLNQIEPRCLAWLVKDENKLEMLRQGYGIYEAHAKNSKLWDGEPGTLKKQFKNIYNRAKAEELSLGYGCGPDKFIGMADLYTGGELKLNRDLAEEIVQQWRVRNVRVVNYWNSLEADMLYCARYNEVYEVELPSGRLLRYTNINKAGSLTAISGYCGIKNYYWGGKLTENVTQAMARDVMGNSVLNCEEAGYPVLWTAHDEGICEVDKSVSADEVLEVVRKPPAWLPDLPIDAEAVESPHYLK